MLTKRSTHVDQILGSESIHSKLSVAIFTALRTHLGAQKCCQRRKKSKKRVNPCRPHNGFSSLRDIAQHSKAIMRSTRVSTFFEVFSPLPTFLSLQMSSEGCKNS